MRATKLLGALLLASFAFVVNPHWGCSSGGTQQEFSYGEAEMKQAVVGTWEGELDDGKGGKVKCTLTIAQNKTSTGTNPLRTTCTNRDFLRAAGACIPTSTMKVKGTFNTDDKTFENVELTGTFRVLGDALKNGELNLAHTDGTTLFASFQDGELQNAKVSQSSQQKSLTLTKKP